MHLLEGLKKRRPLASIEQERDRERGDSRKEAEGDGSALSDLHDRRDRLNRSGDITDCTERFNVEREIYDIIHPKDPDWNDWSAWEEGGTP